MQFILEYLTASRFLLINFDILFAGCIAVDFSRDMLFTKIYCKVDLK